MNYHGSPNKHAEFDYMITQFGKQFLPVIDINEMVPLKKIPLVNNANLSPNFCIVCKGSVQLFEMHRNHSTANCEFLKMLILQNLKPILLAFVKSTKDCADIKKIICEVCGIHCELFINDLMRLISDNLIKKFAKYNNCNIFEEYSRLSNKLNYDIFLSVEKTGKNNQSLNLLNNGSYAKLPKSLYFPPSFKKVFTRKYCSFCKNKCKPFSTYSTHEAASCAILKQMICELCGGRGHTLSYCYKNSTNISVVHLMKTFSNET